MNQFLPLLLASCLFFISHSQITSNTSSQHACLPDHSSALLQLRQEFIEKRISFDHVRYFDHSDYINYYSISYPKMKFWKSDTDCCSWDGVTCDAENGQVIGLDLSNSWLCGSLKSNSSLFSLPHLQKLNLAVNNFSSSTIPSEFGQLVRLTHLNLSHSFLSGQIPSEISWLSNLVSLDLSFNYNFLGYFYLNFRVIDLEAFVQNITNLRELHLDKVEFLSPLPHSLTNLSSLTSLSLLDCFLLGEFPSNIFLLPKIQVIDVSYNFMLSGFLPKFQHGSSLKQLHLSFTNFSGELPNSIGNLKWLSVLDLSQAKFSRKLPNSIGNLKSLKYLDLDLNNFSGAIPPSIGNLSQLTYLSLQSNSFHGQLPFTLANFAKLISLKLGRNLFHGKIPSFLGNLTQLEVLDIKFNNFEAGFPISLTNITQLHAINFKGNKLEGSIPSAITRLSNLSFLGLSYNSLTGAIPLVLYTMPSLFELSLDQNQLSGPLKFQNISSSPLKVLRLSGNKLNGLIPRSIANFTKLQILYLSSNNLKGKMEFNIFFELKELQVLDLSGNNLFVSTRNINSTLPKFSNLHLSSCNLHEFPHFLQAQNELQYLDLSYNNIRGKIPKWFWNVGKDTLQYLNLSFNLLSSFEQPPIVLPWKKLLLLDLRSNILQESFFIPPLSTVYLFASKNKMTGNISPMICKLNHLQVLDLSNNQFIGHIPQCVGNFSRSLSVLAMRNNNFQGNIPETFVNGCSLRTLDLSNNQIQGKIPRSLVRCRMLEVLNIAKNKLNNTFPLWLESLPELQILVLRENGFYGPIWDPHTKFGFSKLRVICLSQNNFSGKLPTEYFRTWNAMLMDPGKNKSQFVYMGTKSIYYKDSLTLVAKGREMELVKILTAFIAIDLSNNRFYGEIPDSVGNLKGLIVLNLSNNSFVSHIPSSLGNLILLESLDLSQNGLSGKIPQQLTSLTFLEYLNLSQNQLIGPIPQGGQFLTFQSSSFEGNLGLCGFQLSKECENNETPTSQPSHESSFGEGFNWKVVVIGYTCGLVIGLVTGHLVISRRPSWFMRTFRVNLHMW